MRTEERGHGEVGGRCRDSVGGSWEEKVTEGWLEKTGGNRGGTNTREVNQTRRRVNQQRGGRRGRGVVGSMQEALGNVRKDGVWV